MKRFLWMGFVLFVYVVCSGCGDTFRPIIIPNPPQFPNPAASHTVVSINDNGTLVSGTAMVIDVSGDSEASVANVGLAPVHAVQQTGSQVLVANHSVTGAAADSLTKLNFSGTVIFSTNTISLPANSAPNFVATTETNQAYVLMPNYLDPTTNAVVPSIQVVNTSANNLGATIPVGNNPDAMAETPNAQKLYVANQADNTISGFNTNPVEHSLSPRTVNGSFNGPLWLVARSDSQRLYVLNGNGIVSTVDTTSTLGPDNMIDASVNVPGAAYMLYDGNLNRLYIPWFNQSTMLGQLTILDVSQSVPAVLAGGPITIPTVAPSSRGASDPCSTTSPQPLTVAAVAALPDGSRAYVGAYYEDASDNFCPQVTVVNAQSYAIKSSIAIPGFAAYNAFCASTRFRIMMAAGGDSSRAYLSSCDGGNVSFIDTSTDTYILNMPAPIGSRLNNPPQNPVFLFAGP